MNLAYAFHWAGSAAAGVVKKVVSQTAWWRAAGHRVKIYVAAPTSRSPSLRKVLEAHPNDGIVMFPYAGRIHRLFMWSKFFSALQKDSPDCLYLRYDLNTPGLVRCVRAFPTVVEINTNDVEEYRLAGVIRHTYNCFTRERLLRRAAGMCFVTRELANSPVFKGFGAPRLVVANGIDLSQFQPLPPTPNRNPHFVFLGSSGQTWHGIEEIIQLAKVRQDWKFSLIGPGANSPEIPNVSNVASYPEMERTAYRAILAQGDIALGSFALFKKRMDEACTLKVREYLALGLPTIIGHNDTDFPEPQPPFLLRLPNKPSALAENCDRVAEFAARWLGKRVCRPEVQLLDWSRKETERLHFLGAIAK